MPEAAPILLPQNQPDFISEPLHVDCAYQEQQSLHSRLLHSRLGRSIITTLAAASLYTGIGVANASSAEADAGLVYEVGNTNGGVFSRNSPHTNDTPRIVGQGAYDGDKVELLCGVTNGEAVGPYSNNTWHYARNLSRPNQPLFWISDRHVMSPNRADTLAPGEKYCGEQGVTPAQNNPNPPGLLNRAPQQEETNWAIPVRPDSNKAAGGQDPKSDLDDYSSTINRVGSCKGAFWGLVREVCVYGEMGRKDYANKKEWIEYVEASTPQSGPGRLEVWGDGFYYKIENEDGHMWHIGRWLKNETNVCSRATDRHGESITSCFKIKV